MHSLLTIIGLSFLIPLVILVVVITIISNKDDNLLALMFKAIGNIIIMITLSITLIVVSPFLILYAAANIIKPRIFPHKEVELKFK